MDTWQGAMQTSDGMWRVDVGGVEATKWYRLVGPGVNRNLPSLAALVAAAEKAGINMGELREIDQVA